MAPTRSTSLDQLFNSVVNGGVTQLVGARGTGKSSLLMNLRNWIGENYVDAKRPLLMQYLNLAHLEGAESFRNSLAEDLGDLLSQSLLYACWPLLS